MRRPDPQNPPLSRVDAGICLLALDHFRGLGLHCEISDADIVRLHGLGTDDPEVVLDEKFRLQYMTQGFIVDGMLLRARTGDIAV